MLTLAFPHLSTIIDALPHIVLVPLPFLFQVLVPLVHLLQFFRLSCHNFFQSLSLLLQHSNLLIFWGEMDLQSLFLVEFTYLKYQFFLVYLKTGDLSPQLCLILLLEMDSTSQFLKLLPLILEQLLVIRLAFLLSQSGVQILHQTVILALVIVLQLSQLPSLFFLLGL